MLSPPRPLLVVAGVQILGGDRSGVSVQPQRLCEQASDRLRARRARFRLGFPPCVEGAQQWPLQSGAHIFTIDRRLAKAGVFARVCFHANFYIRARSRRQAVPNCGIAAIHNLATVMADAFPVGRQEAWESLVRDCVVLALVASSMLSVAASAADAAKPLQLGVAVSAVVANILVAEGAHVQAGETILQMDCRPLEQEIKVRTADLAAAEAVYERVRNGPRPDDIAIGEANVGVAQARSEEAADTYNRLKALTEGVSVAKAQLLEARRDARISAAQLNDAQKRLELLHAGSRAEDVAEGLARHDSAAAELSLAQAKQDQCTVHAPVAGVVELRVTLGQYVSEAVPTTLAVLTPDAPTH